MVNGKKFLKVIITIALVLTSVINMSSYAEVQRANGEVKIIFGSKNKVCLDAVVLIQGLNKDDFGYDKRPELFSGSEWSPSEILHHEYATIDIYNNGTSNVVLADTEMFRSTFSRWLYVMQQEDFQLSEKSKRLDRTKIAQLSPANQVVFENGKTTVPIWSDIWHHGNKNYIVMKEFRFGTNPDEDESASKLGSFDSLYVGILSPGSKKYDADFKVVRLSPKMVCQITLK